jgi:tRNA A37 threonylcarbamoyladenosine dehydratase
VNDLRLVGDLFGELVTMVGVGVGVGGVGVEAHDRSGISDIKGDDGEV